MVLSDFATHRLIFRCALLGLGCDDATQAECWSAHCVQPTGLSPTFYLYINTLIVLAQSLRDAKINCLEGRRFRVAGRGATCMRA